MVSIVKDRVGSKTGLHDFRFSNIYLLLFFTNVIHFGCENIGKLTLKFLMFIKDIGKEAIYKNSFLVECLMSHTIYTS